MYHLPATLHAARWVDSMAQVHWIHNLFLEVTIDGAFVSKPQSDDQSVYYWKLGRLNLFKHLHSYTK